MIWYKDDNDGIVISTRIRLARNIEKTPFPNALANKAEVNEKISSALLSGKNALPLEYIDLNKMSDLEKRKLNEEHLISPLMLEGKDKAVLISKDKTMSIMLMEEDHIRLQVIMGGNRLDEAYDMASKTDDAIEEKISYAFDEEFGYLTACPTNTGTGMRASLMLHLPALTMTRNIKKVIDSASALGITVRGLYGEGSRADGSFYQISNSVTMGITETQIIEKLKTVVNQIIETEKKARAFLSSKSGEQLRDKLYRSYGIVKYARAVSSEEALSLISDVMLGSTMGIIKEKGKISPTEAMVLSSPALICKDKELSAAERDRRRADFLRDNL